VDKEELIKFESHLLLDHKDMKPEKLQDYSSGDSTTTALCLRWIGDTAVQTINK